MGWWGKTKKLIFVVYDVSSSFKEQDVAQR